VPRFHRAKGKRSGFEQVVCSNLDSRGIAYQYEPDKLKYWRVVKGAKCGACGGVTVTRPATYTPDLKFANGTYCEIKGRLTSANRTRLEAFKEHRPEITVRILFQVDNWCTKKKLNRYTDWAKKHGYECAVGKEVPGHWASGDPERRDALQEHADPASCVRPRKQTGVHRRVRRKVRVQVEK
jgi:hypothetical protein